MKINNIIPEGKTGPGLWANIHAKRERIKAGSGEKMRKPGSKGAPTAKNFRDAAKEGVAEAGNKPLEPHVGMGDSSTPRELKIQMSGASDEFVRSTAGKKTGPFHSKVAKMQGKLAKSELRRREQDMTEDFNGEYDDEAGMAKTNLHTIARAAKGLLDTIDDRENLPEWVQEKIAKVEGMLVSAWDYLESQEAQGVGETAMLEETYHGDEFYEAYGDMWFNEDEQLDEAEYRGRKVPLGKPMRGDVKKFKVYVKDPKTGNIKKVNFGDPNMRIKKSNPARRKSFRARHNCANPGPRTKARYWSCRKW